MRPLSLAAIAFLTACPAPVSDTPEDAYRAFAEAANKGDGAVALSRLAAASQESLRRDMGAVATASAGSMRDDAAAFTFHGSRGSPVPSVRLLKKEQDRATVEVTARDGTHEVSLVREGAEWRIELPPRPPLPP